MGAVGVLFSKTIFKMHWKLSFQYLAIRDITEGTVDLEVKLRTKSGIVNLSNLSILLSIRDKVHNIGITKGVMDGAIEVQCLQGSSHTKTEIILEK